MQNEKFKIKNRVALKQFFIEQTTNHLSKIHSSVVMNVRITAQTIFYDPL